MVPVTTNQGSYVLKPTNLGCCWMARGFFHPLSYQLVVNTLWYTFTELWKITIFHWKCHYKWWFSISYVKLPEGIRLGLLSIGTPTQTITYELFTIQTGDQNSKLSFQKAKLTLGSPRWIPCYDLLYITCPLHCPKRTLGKKTRPISTSSEAQ